MTGHRNFDATVHESNRWLHQLTAILQLSDDHLAYAGLRAVLHVLRDQLRPEDAVHLSAQLPMAVRGLFFEGWRMSRAPSHDATLEGFAAHVARELPAGYPLEPISTASGVFAMLWTEIDVGETAKLIDRLPEDLKQLWPSIARRG